MMDPNGLHHLVRLGQFSHPHLHKERATGRAQWLMPVISALWETKAGRSRGQEIETILADMVFEIKHKLGKQPDSNDAKLMGLQKFSKFGWVPWVTPVIPELWEAEADRSLEAKQFETSLANLGLIQSPRVECSRMIMDPCSLEFLGSKDTPASAS
ncbi:NANOG neighbor homeobox [Plecturocebus cupreus]